MYTRAFYFFLRCKQRDGPNRCSKLFQIPNHLFTFADKKCLFSFLFVFICSQFFSGLNELKISASGIFTLWCCFNEETPQTFQLHPVPSWITDLKVFHFLLSLVLLVISPHWGGTALVMLARRCMKHRFPKTKPKYFLSKLVVFSAESSS